MFMGCPTPRQLDNHGRTPHHLCWKKTPSRLCTGRGESHGRRRPFASTRRCGATISRAVDVAEVCRRRNGHIAQGLPETVNIQNLMCESEEVEGENGMRTVSVLRIDLEGVGEMPRLKTTDQRADGGVVEFLQRFVRRPQNHGRQGPQGPSLRQS